MPKRIVSLLSAAVCIFAGLGSRYFGHYFPAFINLYLGDAIWAMMVYFLVQSLFSKLSQNSVLLTTIGFCFSIEFSQLYHAPWIDGIRQTRLGALVLGFGFLWTDLLAYTFGALSVWLVLKGFLFLAFQKVIYFFK